MTWRLPIALVLIAGGMQSPPPQAPRGTITGVVVDSASGEAQSDATVIARSGTSGITALSNDRGEFTFTGLPAGVYELTVTKAGAVTTAFGAKAAGHKGVSIVVTDDAPARATVKMFRVARISGRVTMAGRPAVDATVYAHEVRTRGSARAVVPAGRGPFTSTDEHGEYSLYGLAPGEYVVVALPHADPPDARAGVQPAPRGLTFHPGTTTLMAASSVSVGPGEDRGNVDIALVSRPPSRINVYLLTSAGSMDSSTTIDVAPAFLPPLFASTFAKPRRDPGEGGVISFGGLPAGRYVVTAGTPPRRARAEVELAGGETQDVSLALDEQATVTGRVVLNAHGRTMAPNLRNLGISVVRLDLPATLSPRPEIGWFPPAPSPSPTGSVRIAAVSTAVTPDSDGSFLLLGMAPGRYRLTISGISSGWSLESASTFEVRGSQPVSNTTVVLTDRPSAIGGRVLDIRGEGTADYFIAVVPADRNAWTAGSTAMRFARPLSNGQYRLDALAPGDYYVLALEDVDEEAWAAGDWPDFDVASAVKVTIASGEQKTLNLKAGR